MVKRYMEGNICEKFTDGVESNDHYESTKNKNMLLKVKLKLVKLVKISLLSCSTSYQ